MASSSTHRIGDEPTDSEDMAPGKKQRTGSAPVHSVQEHDYMSTLSAVCASRSLEHLSETLVPAYASSCQEQLSETPAPASGPVSSPTASLRGGASKGTPLPRGKASEPGSEPDASSERNVSDCTGPDFFGGGNPRVSQRMEGKMDSERPPPLPRVRHGRVSKMEVQHDSLQCVRSPQGQAGEAVFASRRTALYLSPCAPALRPLRHAARRASAVSAPSTQGSR
eukprot:scaffold15051_cov124-Isochrysis_galbana.AAC.2